MIRHPRWFSGTVLEKSFASSLVTKLKRALEDAWIELQRLARRFIGRLAIGRVFSTSRCRGCVCRSLPVPCPWSLWREYLASRSFRWLTRRSEEHTSELQ